MFSIAAKRKDRADALAPPRWKIMIASGLAIYPLIWIVQPLLRPYLESWPDWLAAIVNVLILVPLSTLIMIPAVSWALKLWLYRSPPSS